MKIKQTLRKLLPICLIVRLKKIQDHNSKIVYNIGYTIGAQPKVLVSYVNNFLFYNDISNCPGTSSENCSSIVSALIKLGCVVDVARYDCEEGLRSDYDYVIGQGSAFRLASSLNPSAKRILYLTENLPELSFIKEQERIDYFYERHGIQLKLTRSGKFFVKEDFDNLEACVYIGNPSGVQKFPNVRAFDLRPYGIINPLFDQSKRDYNTARKRFFWIGSNGAVHKGLDILLDVFSKHSELELYIIGLTEKDRRILRKQMGPNVKNYGYIDSLTGVCFSNLVTECGFVILPSCSEGIPTSVITGMNHGLIPLVTKETNLEAPTGEIFSDYLVETIEDAIIRWSNKDVDYLALQSEQTRHYALKTFGNEQYSKRIEEILTEIIRP